MFEIMADAYVRQRGLEFMPALSYVKHVTTYYGVPADQLEWGRTVVKRAIAKNLVAVVRDSYLGQVPRASRASYRAGS